jgi:hypothetical protein
MFCLELRRPRSTLSSGANRPDLSGPAGRKLWNRKKVADGFDHRAHGDWDRTSRYGLGDDPRQAESLKGESPAGYRVRLSLLIMPLLVNKSTPPYRSRDSTLIEFDAFLKTSLN